MKRIYPVHIKLLSYLDFFDIDPHCAESWSCTAHITALVILGQQLGVSLPYTFNFSPGVPLWSQLLILDLRMLAEEKPTERFFWSKEEARMMDLVKTVAKEPANWPKEYDWASAFATFYHIYSNLMDEDNRAIAEMRWSQSAKWDTKFEYLPAALTKCAFLKLAIT
jgi:hypothetical protein